jgi:predicted RNA-binding protein associated with RNAse of E/G family
VLQLYRVDLMYAVWMLLQNSAFQNWYVNFEASLVRQADAIDTLDLGLDLVIHQDEAHTWKDVEDDVPVLSSGRMTVTEMINVLEAAEQVSRSLADNRWWSTWDTWRPPTPIH